MSTNSPMRALGRILILIVLAGLSLQLYFVARVALMAVLNTESTTFQRSEMRRLVADTGSLLWSQTWRDADQISDHLKRAVIASEDANFVDHAGIEFEALQKAWQKNTRAEERADRTRSAAQARHERATARALQRGRTPPPAPAAAQAAAKVVGGSTITQQLAKNLFLSKERNFLRKGQEVAITFMLEGLLSKERILTLYLNNVEWGEGVFGAEAAASHYFHVPAQQLAPLQAARLAVMLPAPKRFEKQPGSAYVMGRASTIVARMRDAELP